MPELGATLRRAYGYESMLKESPFLEPMTGVAFAGLRYGRATPHYRDGPLVVCLHSIFECERV